MFKLFQKDLVSDDVLVAAAAAAAIHQDPFYPSLLQPSHFLYSQWLASRNTSALFGLQGTPTSIDCETSLDSGSKTRAQMLSLELERA